MEDLKTYQAGLSEFIRVNPDSDLVPYAEKLLDASGDFEANEARRLTMRYTVAEADPHYFVMVYRRTESLSGAGSPVLEEFSRNYFPDLALHTSILMLDDEYAMTIVSNFSNGATARQYYKTFIDKLETFSELRNHKYDKFVITSDNFNILYRTKGLNEYLQFFERNYRPQTP